MPTGRVKSLTVKLSSHNYAIVDHGTVFLFDNDSDLTLDIIADETFAISVVIHFIEDISETQCIKTEIEGNCVKMDCVNFLQNGTGLTVPMELATVNGKRLYLMFWAYLEGKQDGKTKSRKVEYTLYSEK